jgi:hypothetical protein
VSSSRPLHRRSQPCGQIAALDLPTVAALPLVTSNPSNALRAIEQ